MTYERFTAAPARDVLRFSEDILTERLPLTKKAGDHHSITLEGVDGTVTITVHRHGQETQVHAATDQLRTSRLDYDVRYLMTMLPYQPGDVRGAGTALPGALSRS